MKVILASRNEGKVKELSKILKPLDLDLVSQQDYDIESPEETGLTFIENALIKAREVSEKSGLPSIADDSGISVPLLDGAPGIYSARYAGTHSDDEQNNKKLVHALSKAADKRAFYYCVLVFVKHAFDPTPIIGIGEWHGSIVLKRRGSNGFGYDPHFWLEDYQCTAAELSPAIKNNISHRAKAAAELIAALKSIKI